MDTPTTALIGAYKHLNFERARMIESMERLARTGAACIECANIEKPIGDDTRCLRCIRSFCQGGRWSEFVSRYRRPYEMPKEGARR